MIPIESTNDIDKIIRKFLIEQSEVDEDRIVNSDSLYGPDLITYMNETTVKSITHDDTFIIFNADEDTSNGDNVCMEEDDGTITNYVAFNCLVTVYGDKSSDIARMIFARFRTEKVLIELEDAGIKLTTISDVKHMSEFINGTMWDRRDLSFSFSVMMKIKQASSFKEFENTEINISKVEDETE